MSGLQEVSRKAQTKMRDRIFEIDIPDRDVEKILARVPLRYNVIAERRDAWCRDCLTEYKATKRTYCPKCCSHTVDAWPKEYKEVI